jgi:hypothetical protein
MKPLLWLFLCVYLMGCSPYKKMEVSMSDRMTKRWLGATEQMVMATVGSYKQKATLPDGYLLRFDYSYQLLKPLKNTSDFQVKTSNRQSGIMTPQPDNSPYNEHRNADDSVIKRMDFYFDQFRHVRYVAATGFEDSVYYVKRR